MTDRIKGFLVVLEDDIRDDDAIHIENAIKMIKRVHSVKSYVKSSEDHIIQEKTRSDTYGEMLKFIRNQMMKFP